MTQAINRANEQWPTTAPSPATAAVPLATLEQPQPADLATMMFRPTCPKCGSLSGQWRGYRETKKAFIHRRWCSCCNKWFSINLYQELVSNGQANGDEAREDQLWFDAFMEAYEDALSRGDAT